MRRKAKTFQEIVDEYQLKENRNASSLFLSMSDGEYIGWQAAMIQANNLSAIGSIAELVNAVRKVVMEAKP